MKVQHLEIPEVLLLEPKVFGDARGFFFEAYNRRTFREATGLDVDFVQDNQSQSVSNVLRGLHYQVRQPQGKLVSVVGRRDLRRGGGPAPQLPDLRQVGVGAALGGHAAHASGSRPASRTASSSSPTRRWCSTRPPTTTRPSTSARSLWNDPELAIRWPLEGEPIVSDKDRRGARLGAADLFD